MNYLSTRLWLLALPDGMEHIRYGQGRCFDNGLPRGTAGSVHLAEKQCVWGDVIPVHPTQGRRGALALTALAQGRPETVFLRDPFREEPDFLYQSILKAEKIHSFHFHCMSVG